MRRVAIVAEDKVGRRVVVRDWVQVDECHGFFGDGVAVRPMASDDEAGRARNGGEILSGTKYVGATLPLDISPGVQVAEDRENYRCGEDPGQGYKP